MSEPGSSYPVTLVQSPEFQHHVLEAVDQTVKDMAISIACEQISMLFGLEVGVGNIDEDAICLTLGATQAGNHQTDVFVVAIATAGEGFVLPDCGYETAEEFFEDLNLMLHTVGIEARGVLWDISTVDDHQSQTRTITVLPPKQAVAG